MALSGIFRVSFSVPRTALHELAHLRYNVVVKSATTISAAAAAAAAATAATATAAAVAADAAHLMRASVHVIRRVFRTSLSLSAHRRDCCEAVMLVKNDTDSSRQAKTSFERVPWIIGASRKVTASSFWPCVTAASAAAARK
jgi:hypothetical protein